jgi:hypothetical protein
MVAYGYDDLTVLLGVGSAGEGNKLCHIAQSRNSPICRIARSRDCTLCGIARCLEKNFIADSTLCDST